MSESISVGKARDANMTERSFVGSMATASVLLLEANSVPLPNFLSTLLTPREVPRVIGKGGAIIKELRLESGAVVDILDKQIPEAFHDLLAFAS
jgi:hypothetical protein